MLCNFLCLDSESVQGMEICITFDQQRVYWERWVLYDFQSAGKPSGLLSAPFDPPWCFFPHPAILQGPDTSGQWWYLRSVDSTRPIDDESQLGWTLQLFRIGGSIGTTPASFAPSTLIGEASQVLVGSPSA
jgi:hypothetical protein